MTLPEPADARRISPGELFVTVVVDTAEGVTTAAAAETVGLEAGTVGLEAGTVGLEAAEGREGGVAAGAAADEATDADEAIEDASEAEDSLETGRLAGTGAGREGGALVTALAGLEAGVGVTPGVVGVAMGVGPVVGDGVEVLTELAEFRTAVALVMDCEAVRAAAMVALTLALLPRGMTLCDRDLSMEAVTRSLLREARNKIQRSGELEAKLKP